MRELTPGEKGAVLRRLRLSLGLGRRRLARMCRIDHATIANLESGRRTIGLLRARRLAKALGADVRELLFEGWEEG